MEWFDEKLNLLNGTDDVKLKKNILTEFKIRLSNLSTSESQEITGSLDFNRLLSQLTSNDIDLITEVCEVIKILTHLVEPGVTHSLYSTEMCHLLKHPEPVVKILVLEELKRQSEDKTKLGQLLLDMNLLVAAAETIGDSELSVAKAAMDMFKQIGKHSEDVAVLYTGQLLRTFARLLAKNDVITFRVYEVVADISKGSKEGLQASINSGFLQSLITILDNDDILLQLNVLEILTGLAESRLGLTYLEQQGVLDKLVQRINRAEENPLSNLLVPGLMKFFGNMARNYPNEIFSKYPSVIAGLFDVLQGEDQTILIPALDTLGHVASSVDGKYALQSLNGAMPFVLRKIGQIIQNSTTELRIRALFNLARILEIPKDEQDNRILSLTKEWFDSICEQPLDLIVSLCKQPFADIRQAALEVLAVVAAQVWGQEYMCPLTSLTSFLLDRNIENFKECKEAKYNVVVNLSQAPAGIYDVNTMRRIKQFVSEGPFYVQAQADVATEGAS